MNLYENRSVSIRQNPLTSFTNFIIAAPVVPGPAAHVRESTAPHDRIGRLKVPARTAA